MAHERSRPEMPAANDNNAQPDITTTPKSRIGLFTKTIVPSPVIQFVLPARLRSVLQNDVVFIYERSLLIREIIMDTYLEDVMVNSEFDANIIAAKAIKVQQKAPLDVQMKVGTQDDSLEALPSHILALTLDSRELIFLYYYASPRESSGRFVHFRRALPSDVSISERFGQHLAVDPRSRAIAVAASTDFFGIFMLEPAEELQSQIKEGILSPISEERFFQLEGDILFMDFLFPAKKNENHIVLLLILAKGSMMSAVIYEWESAEGIRHARPKIKMLKVPDYCGLPNLLIPLTKSTSFLLVTPSSIILCKNCLSADLEWKSMGYSDSKYPSIWAKWARPHRHAAYDKFHDDVYLCRENGDLVYVDLSNECVLSGTFDIGRLDCDVDCAFDTIDFSHPGHGGDLLIAAGNTGDGGLFTQIARQQPTCVQRFVNWAPVFDAVTVPQQLHKGTSHSHHELIEDMSDDTHLYLSSASSNNTGAVYEFRQGYEAQIGMIIPLEEFPATRSVWAIPDFSEEGTYFFISDPVSTALLHLSQNEGEEIYAVDDSETALDLSTQTLAAGHTQNGVLVQVTSTSARLTVLGNPSLSFVSDFLIDQTALVATVNEELHLVATVVKSDEKVSLQVGRISSNDDSIGIHSIGELVSIEYEPISILIESLKDIPHVFVGSSDGRFAYYRVEQDGVIFLGEHALELSGDNVSKAIESMALVDWYGTNEAAMYCGLRSGLLVSMDVLVDPKNPKNPPKNPFNIRQRPEKRFGQTVVKLLKNDNTILATCGTGFWSISGINTGDASDFDVQRIWITDQNNSSYDQKAIEVFTVISAPQVSSRANLGGSLVCISDSQLLICSLDHRAKAVPRKIELPGTVNRIHYSDYLKCLVVAYISTELESDPETGIVKRYMRPHLDFLSRNLQFQGPASSQSQKPVGASGERITCILDWVPESGGQRYHFLVIGTARKTQEQKGRVIFLYSRRNAENPEQIGCSVKYIHSFDGPVRAVAAYGESTVMVAAGNDIIPIAPKLPTGGKQWAAAARFKLTSPGVSITVHDTLLYVSTSRESLVILQVVDNKLELYAQDGVRHESLSHQYIGGDLKVVLVSSRGGTISAFSQLGITDTDKIISPAIAEAHLPVSVIRLNAREARPSSRSSFSPSSLSSSSSSTVLYGTTMDGAIYHISILNEAEWRLLRFIQNLCSKDPLISPFLSARKRRWAWADIEPQAKKPSSMHVDGDILSRLLHVSQGGTEYLRRMLESDSSHYSQHYYSSSSSSSSHAMEMMSPLPQPPKSYMQLFTSLFDEVFVDALVEENPLGHFMSWLRRLIQQRL